MWRCTHIQSYSFRCLAFGCCTLIRNKRRKGCARENLKMTKKAPGVRRASALIPHPGQRHWVN